MRIRHLLRSRRALLALAFGAVAVLATACLPPAATGTATGGPILVNVGAAGNRPIDFPDPFIAKFGNTYYGYSTSSNISTVQVIKSTDSVHWSWVGDAFVGPTSYVGATSTGSSWADTSPTWAPGVIERPGNAPSTRYVLYYTATSLVGASAGKPCIGRATSASPEGPFVDESSQPLVCTPDRGGSIDPNPIVVDGQVYLLWQSFGMAPGEPTQTLEHATRAPTAVLSPAPSNELTEVLYGSLEWPNIEASDDDAGTRRRVLALLLRGRSGGPIDYRDLRTVLHVTDRWMQPSVLDAGTRESWFDRSGRAGRRCSRIQRATGMMGFHAWTAPFVNYVAIGDIRYTRSLHILPITFPNGGHNPKIG